MWKPQMEWVWADLIISAGALVLESTHVGLEMVMYFSYFDSQEGFDLIISCLIFVLFYVWFTFERKISWFYRMIVWLSYSSNDKRVSFIY